MEYEDGEEVITCLFCGCPTDEFDGVCEHCYRYEFGCDKDADTKITKQQRGLEWL